MDSGMKLATHSGGSWPLIPVRSWPLLGGGPEQVAKMGPE
jgi:hypothetical protein